MHLEKYILISKEGEEEAALCIGQRSDPPPLRKATVDIILCLFISASIERVIILQPMVVSIPT